MMPAAASCRMILVVSLVVILIYSGLGACQEDGDLNNSLEPGTCETLPSSIHVTKEEMDGDGNVVRVCEGDITVSKCEGTCSSQLKPSVASQTGFHKVRPQNSASDAPQIRPYSNCAIASPISLATNRQPNCNPLPHTPASVYCHGSRRFYGHLLIPTSHLMSNLRLILALSPFTPHLTAMFLLSGVVDEATNHPSHRLLHTRRRAARGPRTSKSPDFDARTGGLRVPQMRHMMM